ncbi:MAG: kelch repeat-containing protein [bacterium]
MIVWANTSSADVLPVVANLPEPGRFYHGVASDGADIFIFGGTNGNTYPGGRTDIIRYDPATNTVESLSDTLPYDLDAAPAVFANGKYYLFGGFSTTSSAGFVACNGSTGVCAGDRDDILRYDPQSNAVDVVAHLPVGRHGASAVWTGEYVFIFGGVGFTDIIRFDPSNNDVSLMGAQLPRCLGHTSVVWDGAEAFVFGGYVGGCETGGGSTQILRYDPVSDTVTVAAAAFPYENAATSAIWDGTFAYIFGDDTETVWRYDPNEAPPQTDEMYRGSGASRLK